MKKNIAKIFSLLVVGILLVGVLCGVTAYANTNDETVKIVFNNVEYGEKMKLMFAVDVPDGMSARVDICNENGTVLATTTQGEDEVIDGVTYKTFTSDLGVSAQNISTVVYAKAYLLDAEGNETGATDTQRYSVLEYLYKRLNVDTDVTTEQRAMYESCLEYAKYAEKVLTDTADEDRIENYVYVAVKNGTIDGTYSAGIYKKGTPALSAIAADLVAGENEKIVYTIGETSYTEDEIKSYVVNDHTVVGITVEEEATVVYNTVTMKYSGTTTGSMTTGDNASTMGLDANTFDVLANKGGSSNMPGLNKSGDFRLYYAASGGNSIVVSVGEGCSIKSIKITFNSASYAKNCQISAGDTVVLTTDGSTTEVTADINASSFTLKNVNTTNVQVRINSVEIEYSTVQ